MLLAVEANKMKCLIPFKGVIPTIFLVITTGDGSGNA